MRRSLSAVPPMLFVAVLGILVGCSTERMTTTSRTAMEELLISTAVDKALDKLDLPMLKDSKVFIDYSNLRGTDVEYLKVALRAKVARDGSILATNAKDADYVMEVANGALAMEDKSNLIGMPSLPVPQSPVPAPEVPLFKSTEQTAVMKLLIFVQKKGKFVACDQYFAKSDRDQSFLMWYRFERKDDVRQGWLQADARLARRKLEESIASTKKKSEPAEN